jgi:glycosyltransferase involved in cell wall biosynthesis
MQSPTVSAVIPSYNRGHLVGAAIHSAVQDLGPDDEILVVDDGSNDDTEQVVKQFRDGRIRYIGSRIPGLGPHAIGAQKKRHET